MTAKCLPHDKIIFSRKEIAFRSLDERKNNEINLIPEYHEVFIQNMTAKRKLFNDDRLDRTRVESSYVLQWLHSPNNSSIFEFTRSDLHHLVTRKPNFSKFEQIMRKLKRAQYMNLPPMLCRLMNYLDYIIQ